MPVTVERIGRPTDGKTIGEWIKGATKRAFYDAVREEVAKGFDPQPVVVTDGVPRRDPEQVRVGGKIEAIRRPQMAEAVLWALGELARRSPIGPPEHGHYRDDHLVLLNKVQVDPGRVVSVLRAVKEGDRVQIVNPRIYARKLEGATASKKTGRQKRRGTSAQARAGIYRPVLRALVQRYGRSMFFNFDYVKLNTGVKVWGKAGGSTSAKRVQRDQVYPSLSFYIKPTGQPN